MGFRFRKSKKIGPVRINFSKSGVGYSIGGKGARITKTANGRTRTTLSVPGTGISYVTESGRKRKRTKATAPQSKRNMGCGVALLVVLIAFVVIIVCIVKNKDGTYEVTETYDQRQIIYTENHPRIYDTIESVETYINGQNTSGIRIVDGIELLK